MKPYTIRKMGTRRGQPHYGCGCLLCPEAGGRILRIGYLSKAGAETVIREHMLTVHGRALLAPKPHNSSTK
jgi:hypothetical protein